MVDTLKQIFRRQLGTICSFLTADYITGYEHLFVIKCACIADKIANLSLNYNLDQIYQTSVPTEQ